MRIKVLQNLKKPHTPSQLCLLIRTHRSTISRAILALESKDLVKCITPDESMGRYYQISDKGEKILEMIMDNKNVKK